MKPIWCTMLVAVGLLGAGCAGRAPAPAPPVAAPAAAAATGTANTPADPDAAGMPTGAGKADVVRVCGGCHTLARVVRLHQTRAQWQATIAQMRDNGLFASPATLSSILDYLSKNYGSTAP